MHGVEIVVRASAQGIFEEGTIAGTPLPGQMVVMQGSSATLTAAGTPTGLGAGGRPVYEPLGYNNNGTTQGASTDPRPVGILVNDADQGQAYNTAYVDGARCFVYFPIPGEELNIVYAGSGSVGTGSLNAVFYGQRLSAQAVGGATTKLSTGGQFVDQGTTGTWAQFRSLEHVTFAVGVVGWVFAQFQGR
jgi:hypothetical protein